jgi:ribonuclease BN (tRNA processing enzyme)
VLASGSSGNCSALVLESGQTQALWLIDAGLSTRRTHALLAALGLRGVEPRGIILTHLDDDHANPTTLAGLTDHVPVLIHRRHLKRAEREGRLFRRTEVFQTSLDLAPGFRALAHIAHHDVEGSVAFRFTLDAAGAGCEIGFATDIGRPTEELAHHLAGVDVLAIESNYCPELQWAAKRPELVKKRVMGGNGHLSNQQCARLVRSIAPARHVVLLHLSRQCNTPELAAREHAGASYRLTVSSHAEPTGWIETAAHLSPRRPGMALSLFEA